MWLEQASRHLGWPEVEDIINPTGGGPGHYAQLVEQKVGNALCRKFDLSNIETGILSANSTADTAEAPLAIVLQFSQGVADDVLREAQRLCWNFSKSALLVTLEPTRIQAWSCSMAPTQNRKLHNLRVMEPIEATAGETEANVLQGDIAQTLHWVNLVSGAFLDQHKSKFQKKERADVMLVANLRAVRKKLLAEELPRDTCHAMLARLIFTQFLFQRTDSEGRPAISQSVLDGRFDGHLANQYQHEDALRQILGNKEETYALFRWLNDKFNGDLFPGKGETAEERETEWESEKKNVTDKHLKLLAEFVAGDVEVKSGQRSLWPLYSFDTLPLEFISSVYEEFLNEDQHQMSAYYTPPHLVDFVLDGVLPWGGTEWDLKILDPCCGSGIFLVKAFQRLVQRWKNANPGYEPRVDDLRGLLENNLFGVDDHEDAIRVASFSLCLALCDAIDPRQYWKRTIFPPLRNIRLIKSDFFSEEHDEFATPDEKDGRKPIWDLVVGNAPWRDSSLDDESLGTAWASKHGWPVADGNAGPLFLAKGAALTLKSGRVSMILPAATLLYQRSSKESKQLRTNVFSGHRVEEVVSFAHLRWQLFKGVKSPACLVTLRPSEPESDYTLTYICPKPLFTTEDESVIAIERQDTHELSAGEAIHNPVIWTILLLGQRRDANLIDTLRLAMTLRKLESRKIGRAKDGQLLLTREGLKRGDRCDTEPRIINRRILEDSGFPDADSFFLNAKILPKNKDPEVHRFPGEEYFELPQLLIKKSLIKSVGRFQAQVVNPQGEAKGVLCTKSFVSVHQFSGTDDWLSAACLAFRSSVSTYHLALTSRLAFDRAEALAGHILDVPLPDAAALPALDSLRLDEVDRVVEDAFQLKEPERALISDLLEFGYREGSSKPGEKPSRNKTRRVEKEENDDLMQYADFFIKTLRATFGKERAVRATVFEEAPGEARLPVRMVAIHLDWPGRRRLCKKEMMQADELRAELAKFYEQQMTIRSRDGQPISSGLGFRRVARVFVTQAAEDGTKIPTVLFVKPDQRRYWSRSQGLRDADELAAAIVADRQNRATAK
ncbi:N-6 DNA Methylase [Rubripirellula lacrimiformis]|uniref:N-6 DNA Methylase n=2 Tax=Rubripirellula lacrimiformis TaxID=1930273 RepID=A0A517NJ94_9BACT|nr:N-6 DNA Methylase [Rubripirellula lacrimiformis]